MSNYRNRYFISLSALGLILLGITFVIAQAQVAPSHPANQVRPGAFQSGSYSFPSALTIGSLLGAGLASCSGANQKLLYSSATGLFSCGVDLDTTGATTAQIAAGSFQSGTYSFPGALSTNALTVIGALTLPANSVKGADVDESTLSCSSIPGLSAALCDGSDDSGGTSPTVGTSCVLLGSLSAGQATTITTPACLLQAGGCRLLLAASGVLSSITVSKLPGLNTWVATGTKSTGATPALIGAQGSFADGFQQPFFPGASCLLSDDAGGAQTSMLFSNPTPSNVCQLFACP